MVVRMRNVNIRKYKKIIGFVSFIIIITVLFSKVTWLFRGNSVEAREDILGYGNEKCSIDVILFDGSDVLRFYDPLEAWNKYGYTSYNYATSGAQTDMLRFYAEESRKTQDANLYVFDLRTITFVNSDISESTLRNWSDSVPVYSWVRAKGIYSYLFNRDIEGIDIPSYFIDIINYHTKYDSLSSERQWSYLNTNNIYNVDKGFDPNKNHTPFSKPISTEERGEITDKQWKTLTKLVNYCDEERLNALFICSPFVINEEDQKLMNAVSDFIEESGYEFIDFNKYYDEIGIDFETDYGDVNHVNYLGAKKFTDYFTDLLVNKYDLNDHRSDEAYSAWNDDYAKMEEKRNSWMNAVQNELKDHLEAAELGRELHNINDFLEWYGNIQNSNFTVLIKMTSVPKDLSSNNPFILFLSDYSIDPARDHYIGAWKDADALYSSSDELETELYIGVDGGRGTDLCKLSITPNKINIGGVEYSDDNAPIQIVVYDNNYKEVIDSVRIQFTTEDTVVLNRTK